MKRILLLVLLCQLLTMSAKKQSKLVIEETLYFQDTSIQLCYLGKQDYILIINNYDNTFYSLVVFSDSSYTARQVFGELLIAYYKVKNSKKQIAEYEGEKYTIQKENLEGERIFLDKLTDENILKKYKSFKYIDANQGKKEKITYSDKIEMQEDEIGSNAGYLMRLDASDFIELLVDAGKEK